MDCKKHVLKNGVRLLIVPMPHMESATVTVWVGVGSRHEHSSIAGISHFLEHIVFKGGSKYKTAKEVSEAVDAMGAEFNAATSKDWTNFYIKARVGVIEKAYDVLSDMVLSPKLDQEDINRERGVIIEEMNMYEDTPMYRIGDIFDQALFEGSPLGLDIIGNKDTIGKKINKKDFIEFRKTHYTADNIVISVAGGVDEEKAIALTEKYFGTLPKSTNDKKSALTLFKPSQSAPKLKLISKKIEQAHFIVGFLGNMLDDSSKYVESVLATILGNGMSSRLFTEVREKRGLAYSVRTSSDHFIETGSLGTYAGVDPKKATEALKVILDECYNLSQNNKKSIISGQELKKAKDYIKGHIALSLENTRAVNEFFGYDELLLNKFTTPEEDYKGIDTVTAEEVVSLAAKLFKKENLCLAIIGPFEDGLEFEKVLKSH